VNWLRENRLTAFGAAGLAGGLLVNLRTLKQLPELFVDESYYSSTAWGASEGLGLTPTIMAGSGVYDGTTDSWAAWIGSLPHIAAELVLPTSFTVSRGVTFLVAAVAVLLVVLALSKVLPIGLSLLSGGALATSTGFVIISHWVRWDAMAALFLAAIMLLLIAGPPRLLAAGAAGALLGLSPDFGMPVLGVFPAVLLLCAWRREKRGGRVLALLGGLAAGMLVYGLLHFTGGFDQAERQFDAFYEPLYGGIPLWEAIRELSFAPLLDEADRWFRMSGSPSIGAYVTFVIGTLAAVLTLARGLGAPERPLWALGAAVVVAIPVILVLGEVPYDPLRALIGLLIVAGVGLLAAQAVQVARGAPYPRESVPAMLLISFLLGLGLLVSWKAPNTAYLGVPLAVAAIAVALRELAPEGLRTSVPVVGLTALLLFSSGYVLDQGRKAIYDPALDPALSDQARELIPAGSTVMGDSLYWWLFRDERFIFNSTWLQRWQHPNDTVADSFHRVCPDYVLLDDLWLDHYRRVSFGRQLTPNLYPRTRGEREQVFKLLGREYRKVEVIPFGVRTLRFFERRAPDCPAPPTS